jgi:PAS domain-containing protein
VGSSDQFLDQAEIPLTANPDLADDSFLLSALLENSTDRIYFKDFESRFVKINRFKAQMLHLSDRDEAIGKTDQDFLAGDYAKDRRQDELDIIQSGQPLEQPKIDRRLNCET